jgi:hypothetical protein
MVMICICRRRSRSRDRGNRKRSQSPADRHGSSRYKRSRSRERYVLTVTFSVLSGIFLLVIFEVCEVLKIKEEICETGTRNVKVNLKSQVCCI